VRADLGESRERHVGDHLHSRLDVMGTVVTFDLYVRTTSMPREVTVQLAHAKAFLRRVDAVLSTWNPESPLSQLRRGELTLEDAPAMVREVLDACAIAKEMSRGWFDPWAMPGGVDPTGYVKGWAGLRALEHFRSLELTGAMVNAAGDVASFGGPRDGERFRIGVISPTNRSVIDFVVEGATCIATSGSYERVDHLIDPWTRQPCTRALSASVTGPDLGIADALATALVVAGRDGLMLFDDIEGYEGAVVTTDGERHSTALFPFAP
jgi:thiamine biosynthesis lipoprotein